MYRCLRVCYTLAARRFQGILSVGLRVHSYSYLVVYGPETKRALSVLREKVKKRKRFAV